MYMLADKEVRLIHPKQLEVGMAAAEPVMVLLVMLALPVAAVLILELMHSHYMLELLLPVVVAAVQEHRQATLLSVEPVAVLPVLTDITLVTLLVVPHRQVLVEAQVQLKPHLVMVQHVVLRLPEHSELEVGAIQYRALLLAAAAAGTAAAAATAAVVVAVPDISGLRQLLLATPTLRFRPTIICSMLRQYQEINSLSLPTAQRRLVIAATVPLE